MFPVSWFQTDCHNPWWEGTVSPKVLLGILTIQKRLRPDLMPHSKISSDAVKTRKADVKLQNHWKKTQRKKTETRPYWSKMTCTVKETMNRVGRIGRKPYIPHKLKKKHIHRKQPLNSKNIIITWAKNTGISQKMLMTSTWTCPTSLSPGKYKCKSQWAIPHGCKISYHQDEERKQGLTRE